MGGLGEGAKKKPRAITGGTKTPAGKPAQVKNDSALTEPRSRKTFLLADTQIERFEDYLHDLKKQGTKTDMTKVVRDIIEQFLVGKGY